MEDPVGHRVPDYRILSGGGDLFSPETDPAVFQQLVTFIRERTEGTRRYIDSGEYEGEYEREED